MMVMLNPLTKYFEKLSGQEANSPSPIYCTLALGDPDNPSEYYMGSLIYFPGQQTNTKLFHAVALATLPPSLSGALTAVTPRGNPPAQITLAPGNVEIGVQFGLYIDAPSTSFNEVDFIVTPADAAIFGPLDQEDPLPNAQVSGSIQVRGVAHSFLLNINT